MEMLVVSAESTKVRLKTTVWRRSCYGTAEMEKQDQQDPTAAPAVDHFADWFASIYCAAPSR